MPLKIQGMHPLAPGAGPHMANPRPRRRAHCPRVRTDSLTAEAFYERFLRTNRPCILTGAIDGWGAVRRRGLR